MTDYCSEQERHLLTLRDCSNMDSLVVERLRDTVQISLNWADEILDVLIRIDRDVDVLETALECYAKTSKVPGSALLPEIELINAQYAKMAAAADSHLNSVRTGLRDAMTSMQNQDVIGQSIDRAASILNKRSEAMAKAAQDCDHGKLRSNEIADLHREYLADDDLHRAPVSSYADKKAA